MAEPCPHCARYRDALESLAAYLDGASPEAWSAEDVRAVLRAEDPAAPAPRRRAVQS